MAKTTRSEKVDLTCTKKNYRVDLISSTVYSLANFLLVPIGNCIITVLIKMFKTKTPCFLCW